jgi:hypothetical protein
MVIKETIDMTAVNELLLKLKQLEGDNSITSILTPLQEQEGYYREDLHPLVREIFSLADNLLITKRGQPDWDNIKVLKQEGFPVRSGDSDSFGWLTGIITTSKGDIMFG